MFNLSLSLPELSEPEPEPHRVTTLITVSEQYQELIKFVLLSLESIPNSSLMFVPCTNSHMSHGIQV
jgi:hypothetical protein